jgi:ketosteroid isomerase-like protein
MTIASDLLQRHFQTLVEDNAQWQTLIADDLVWELPYAPAIGHPARLSGRAEVVRHVTWFLEAVENFRFYDLKVYAFSDLEAAVAEVKAEGLIKPTGRIYRQDYVSSVRRATRSRSCANISIPCVQLKRWKRRFLVLDPDFQTARGPVGHEAFRMAISCHAVNGRKNAHCAGQPEDHHFGPLIILAVTAGASKGEFISVNLRLHTFFGKPFLLVLLFG